MSRGRGKPPMSTHKIPLGKIVPTHKGEYTPGTQYEGLDIVSYGGSSYISKSATTGQPPTNTTFWTLLAAKGRDGLDADSSYVHDQILPSSIWTIYHALNRFPTVTVVDSSGNVVMGDIQYISANEVKITFRSEFSGKAYLN